jgi:hypothetical protein
MKSCLESFRRAEASLFSSHSTWELGILKNLGALFVSAPLAFSLISYSMNLE